MFLLKFVCCFMYRHTLFGFFTSLVDAYTKCLMPSKEDTAKLEEYLSDDQSTFSQFFLVFTIAILVVCWRLVLYSLTSCIQSLEYVYMADCSINASVYVFKAGNMPKKLLYGSKRRKIGA